MKIRLNNGIVIDDIAQEEIGKVIQSITNVGPSTNQPQKFKPVTQNSLKKVGKNKRFKIDVKEVQKNLSNLHLRYIPGCLFSKKKDKIILDKLAQASSINAGIIQVAKLFKLKPTKIQNHYKTICDNYKTNILGVPSNVKSSNRRQDFTVLELEKIKEGIKQDLTAGEMCQYLVDNGFPRRSASSLYAKMWRMKDEAINRVANKLTE